MERSLRKLTVAGVSGEPAPSPGRGWRALVSGIDGDGYRAVWFVAPAPAPVISLYKPGEVTFLGAFRKWVPVLRPRVRGSPLA